MGTMKDKALSGALPGGVVDGECDCCNTLLAVRTCRRRVALEACGYALANQGHDSRAIQGWLGHRSITSTAVYVGAEPVQGLLAGLMRNRRGPKCGCRRHETNVEARAELFVGFSDDRGLDVVV
jgi:hypothetical protein